MSKFIRTLADFALGAFLATSAAVAALWLALYSGIVWTTPVTLMDSFWTVTLSLAKHWGPIFVPTAAVLFVVKMFEKNVVHEILAAMKPEIGRQIEGAVHVAVRGALGDKFAAGVDRRMKTHSLIAIQSVFRALAREPNLSPQNMAAIYAAARRDFERLVATRSHKEEPVC